MKIKTRFILVMAVLIFSITTVGVQSSIALNNTVERNDELKKKTEMQVLGKHIQFLLAGLSNDERGLLMTSDMEYAKEMKKETDDLQATVQKMKKLASTSAEKEMIDEMSYNLEKYWALNQSIIKNVLDDNERAQRIHFTEETSLRKEVVEPSINKLVEELDKQVAELKDELGSMARISQIVIISINVIATVIGLVLGYVLLRSIFKPLNEINRQMEEVARGDGDLTKQISVRRKDEFGDLAQSFNAFITSIRGVIKQISESSEQVAASSEEFSASAEQSKVTSEQVSAAMQEISASTNHQSDMTEQSTVAVRESLEGLVTISASTQELADKTVTVKEQAEKGAQSVSEIVVQMESIHHSVEAADKGINSLASTASKIGNITGLINEIAGQTNLLALNAAIEAARAGEHGKGFAVVAEEVRKLAEQSSKSANQIQDLITSIQGESSDTVQSIQTVKETVSHGIVLSDETATQFKEIRSLILQVSSQIQEIAGTTRNLSTGFEQVAGSIEEISGIMKNTSDNTIAAAASTEEQLASMEEILNSANSLSKLAEDLQTMVHRFKI
ncbi:methyl-accepting chemotaxis protein [Mesobacillus jeotgali]|uniref:methyl-accepting chemotaxis protein n=1 Tax=Mesobacillus jeotgali TaxID=129985 RepID=UPI0009A8F735|nr:methyl-accepting chemotaxis protein [Mesobacillus jeotgali]